MVTIDDFARLDIRVGVIRSVEDHSAARKPMYKLSVDFGVEMGIRTIIAGIKDYYPVDELSGKKIVCLVNLDPKDIAGIKSEGMLLAAEDVNGISVLVPDKDVLEGSKIR